LYKSTQIKNQTGKKNRRIGFWFPKRQKTAAAAAPPEGFAHQNKNNDFLKRIMEYLVSLHLKSINCTGGWQTPQVRRQVPQRAKGPFKSPGNL
jgi:hypothetical protein